MENLESPLKNLDESDVVTLIATMYKALHNDIELSKKEFEFIERKGVECQNYLLSLQK